MNVQGYLRKMNVDHQNTVQYALFIDNDTYPLNNLIGSEMSIQYLNSIQCIACQKSTLKSYNQGYCYHCFKVLARNDRCIMAPEHCHYHQGTCREPEWGLSFCMQEHIVYLSWTSGFKVGITRYSQKMTRWMDQGATHAVAIAKVKSRYQAGLVEDYLRQWYRDRTQWKAMIQMDDARIDLQSEANKMIEYLKDMDVEVLTEAVSQFQYPIEAIGELTQLSLDKQNKVSGYLLGIKGQYLILDSGVFNVRKHTAYHVKVSW